MKSFIHTCLCIILTSTFIYTQNTVWNGNVDSDWNNPGNWNNGVPTASHIVAINASANQPVISPGYSAAAEKITINNGAILTMEIDAYLNINGMDDAPQPLLDIMSGGQVVSEGFINVEQSIGIGVLIRSGGIYTNQSTGFLRIQNTENDPIRNQGGFTNVGLIQIFGSQAANSMNMAAGPHGILNTSIFSNNGEIWITGTFELAEEDSSIRNSGTFTNNECGFINIEGVLRNAAGATGPFTNNGLIHSSYTSTNVNNNANGFFNNGILANITGTYNTSSDFFNGDDVDGSSTGEYRTNDSFDGFCLDTSNDIQFINMCDCSNELNQFDVSDLENSLFQDSLIIYNVPDGVVPYIGGENFTNALDNNGLPLPEDGSIKGELIAPGTYFFSVYHKPNVPVEVFIRIGAILTPVTTGNCTIDLECLAANGIAIPTLGQWGLLVLFLIILIIGSVVIMKKAFHYNF